MNVENLSPEVQKALTMQVLRRGMPALAYIDILTTPNYLKDFNDRIVLETLLLNEQDRTDCTEEEHKKIIGLLVYYWREKGEGASMFLPKIVIEAKEEAWEAGESNDAEHFKNIDELANCILQDKIEDRGIPDFRTLPKTTFEDLFDEEK